MYIKKKNLLIEAEKQLLNEELNINGQQFIKQLTSRSNKNGKLLAK